MARGPQASRRGWWVAGIALVLGLAAAAAYVLRPHGALVEVAAARLGDLTAQVSCDGILEAPPGGQLRASESGLVADLPVRDGDAVHTGQVVLRLDNPELASRQRQAEAEVLRLQAQAREAEASAQQAGRDVRHLQEVVAADRRLVEQAAATRAELEADQLSLTAAQTRERTARAQLAALHGPSGQERLARGAVSALARRLQALELRAPRDGVVYGLSVKAGEMVQEGQLLAGIADPGTPRVRLRVDQPDLPKIASGQHLQVTFPGLPGREFEGSVVLAAPVLREVDGREVGEVTGEISDPQHLLPLNASVDAKILLAERRGVLIVPRAALYREGDRRYVYLLRDGRARRRDVTAGLIGLTEVEITGGLAVGDRVVLAGEVPLVEGLRVTPAA